MNKRLVRKSDAEKVAENGVSVFSEYRLPLSDFAVGVSEIQGRYPQTGCDVDDEIDQVWYVESGSAKIRVGDEHVEVSAGDMLHVAKGEPYVIDGTVKLVVVSGPPWNADQHRHIVAA